MSESKLTTEELSGFTGTQHYFGHWSRRLVYTDGIAYLAERAGAHWLVDAIASYQADPRILNSRMLRDIQFWTLEVADGTAVLKCVEDAGRWPAIAQTIEYTDFPLDRIDLWVERGSLPTEDGGYVEIMVLMLPSER